MRARQEDEAGGVAVAGGRYRSRHRLSGSNISRWKASSMRRTVQVSAGALRFSRWLSPLT